MLRRANNKYHIKIGYNLHVQQLNSRIKCGLVGWSIMSLESNFLPHREAAGAEAQAPGYHLFSILHPSECIFGPDVVASWDEKAARLPASHCFTSGARKGQGLCLHQESSISPTPTPWPTPTSTPWARTVLG